MGDRTYVSIYMTPENAKRPEVREWENGDNKDVEMPSESYGEEYPKDPREAVYFFGFEQVNYGELPDVEEFLQGLKISYDFRWDSGDEYVAGTRWVRFAKDGTMRKAEAYDDDHIDLDRLKELLAEDSEGNPKAAVDRALRMIEVWEYDKRAPCALGEEPETFNEEEN